jgi:hypothetical protein
MKTNTQTVLGGSVNGAPLIVLRAEGLFVFFLSILLYAHTGVSWWRFAALLLVPDISMAGYWLGQRWGAVGYNFAHSYIGPLVLVGFVVVRSQSLLLPYLIIWIAHIAMDRALGYGLKYSAGFKKTHLGWMGA